jgi:large subunit ribosomal protein L21
MWKNSENILIIEWKCLLLQSKKIITMFAIVDIAGQQFKVVQDQTLFVHRLAGNAGDSVNAKVLMVADGGNITLNSGTVTGEIVEHLQGDKVITFHKKRRKGYEKKIGHRQQLTKVKINSIA